MLGMQMSAEIRTEVRCELRARMKILLKVASTIITPEGLCQSCGAELTEKQIKAGWRDIVTDYTTECPKCHKRFVANLSLTDQKKGENIGRVTYLCQPQLFARIAPLKRGKLGVLGPTFLLSKHPEVFWNMIRHFGTYDLALKAFRSRPE